jgi:hypothetical protein
MRIRVSNQCFQGCNCKNWEVSWLIEDVYDEIRSTGTWLKMIKTLIKNPNLKGLEQTMCHSYFNEENKYHVVRLLLFFSST